MLNVLLTIVHISVCLILIMVVLLQTGKRADLAGAFGGGGSQTAFGARGAATFLSRMTSWCAVIFMVTSLLLALLASASRGGASVLDAAPGGAPAPVPVAPVTPLQPAPGAAPAEPSADPGVVPQGGEAPAGEGAGAADAPAAGAQSPDG